MKKRVKTVKEYDEICSEKAEGYVFLPEKDMDCLVEYVQTLGKTLKKDEKAPATIQYKYSYEKKCSIPVVKIQKYVGELELKSGLRLQILPKIYFGGSEDRTKQIYLEMLKSTYRLKEKAMNQISLGTGDMELFEAYIRMYLDEAQMLVKRGLRSAYEEKTDNLRCFRGKLQVAGHIRRNIVHKERFYVTYEEFTKNRPENRLIKATLKKLQKVTTDEQNKQDARELLLLFDGIQESMDYPQDFARIRIDRNSREYEKIMKWTEVILQGNSFLNFSDGIKARSILFAMDEVFENYVACQIKKYFRENWEVSSQDENYYLFEKPWDFQLRPDIVMKKREGNRTLILDTKWKSLPDMKNEGWSAFNKKARNDIYQMVTYASRYEAEEIWLLYPKAKYSYQYEGIRDRFETKIYGHILVIHLFFIDLENMEESMKRLSQGLESKMAGEVKKYE